MESIGVKNKFIRIVIALCMIVPFAASANKNANVRDLAPKARSPFSVDNPSAVKTDVISPGSAMVKSEKHLYLREDMLLSQGLKSWASENGYKLLWNSRKDYIIYNNLVFSGKDDDELLSELGKLFFSENYGLVVKRYIKNNVIVIDEQ